MISLLPITRVISWIAMAYAVVIIVVGIASSTQTPLGWHTVHQAITYGTVLSALLGALASFGWKLLWRFFPSLNQRLFPLLDGEWSMTIHWQRNNESGEVSAKAIIKQTLLAISMEVLADDSNSETLIAQPKRDAESGTPILYYVYRVTPKLRRGETQSPYLGSAILKFYPFVDHIELSGNYFTSASTAGHFELSRISTST
ncbi:hypothetical protein EKH79_03560 [Dyella dinghuensis]|uniref:CD-NTase-associated protein 15 domain-containing protein n=1 Tax=Dyella dinghuensis TaxID=1920169 RepID=A0A3S0RF53_9GAMM|nr:hypothetical protein [Dyella dinghuensis]RUL65801.1 hypothetical protein EKH79_03560 [Dyella dinghuensis]